jgi:hypothetical protein
MRLLVLFTLTLSYPIFPKTSTKKETKNSISLIKCIIDRYELHYFMLLLAITLTTAFSCLESFTIYERITLEEYSLLSKP